MVVGGARDRSRGFSLVELMVGMVLGLMLIAGAVSIYLATKRSYVEVEQVATLTESARFAEQILGESLRLAGFFGEVAPNKIDRDPDLAPVDYGSCAIPAEAEAYNLTQFVFADEAGSGWVAGCISDVMPDTDVLVVKYVSPRPFSDGPRESFDPDNPAHGDGVIDTPHGLTNGKTWVMTNNVSGLIFDGNDTPPTIGIGGEIPGGTAWEYQYAIYYVRLENPGAVPQLSRKFLKWNGTAMELKPENVSEDLAEGVENLQILFGYDSDSDGEVDSYVNSSQISAGGHWADIESVEVIMLVRSPVEDVQYTDAKTYQLGGGDTVGPYNDYYRRLISHTSVSLRNLKLMIRGGA